MTPVARMGSVLFAQDAAPFCVSPTPDRFRKCKSTFQGCSLVTSSWTSLGNFKHLSAVEANLDNIFFLACKDYD